MKQRRSAADIRADRIARSRIRRDQFGQVIAADKERFDALERERNPAPKPTQQQQIRRNSEMSNDKNPLNNPENMTREQQLAYRRAERQTVERIALIRHERGEISREEARRIGQYLLKSELADMDGDTYDALRSSPQWSQFETMLRNQPDNISSADYEKLLESDTRKTVAHALSSVWLDGHVSDAHALEALARVVPVDHIEGDAGDKMVALSVDILSPENYKSGAAKYEQPKPRQLPEHATERDMKYTAQDDRVRGPATRERYRAAKAAEREKADDTKKAEEAARSHSNVERGVHYPDREEGLGQILESALTKAQLDITQAKFDGAYPDAYPDATGGGGDAGGGGSGDTGGAPAA